MPQHETEVLKRIEEPLRTVVQDAVKEAITTASKIESEDKQPLKAEQQRPKTGGRCAAVWDELDKLNKNQKVPSLKQIITVGKRKKWNENNTRVEYYQWRRFHGIEGRNPLPSDIMSRKKDESYSGPERRVESRRERDLASV
mgnify:CR=1 FL=1